MGITVQLTEREEAAAAPQAYGHEVAYFGTHHSYHKEALCKYVDTENTSEQVSGSADSLLVTSQQTRPVPPWGSG